MKRRNFLKLSSAGTGLLLLGPLYSLAQKVSPEIVSNSLADEQVHALMATARENFYKNEFDVAEKIYHDILKRRKSYIPAYDRLCAIYNRKHEYNRTVALLENANSLNPDSVQFMNRLAKALRVQGLNARKDAPDRDQLFAKSIELSERASKKKNTTDSDKTVHVKTLNSIKERNKVLEKKKLPLIISPVTDTLEVSQIVTQKQLKEKKSPTQRKRIDLFDERKEALRQQSITKHKKQQFRAALTGEQDPVEKQKIARDVFELDNKDGQSYSTLKVLAKQNKDYATLESVSRSRAEESNDEFSKLGQCKVLVYCFEETRDSQYLQQAQEIIDALASLEYEDAKLKSSVVLMYAKVYALQGKHVEVSNYLEKVLAASDPVEVYLRLHGLIAYAKNLESTGERTMAIQILSLVVDKETKNKRLKKYVDLLPVTAGEPARQNRAAYDVLLTMAQRNKDHKTAARARDVINSCKRIVKS